MQARGRAEEAKNNIEIGLRHSERGAQNVFRQPRDPGRCKESHARPYALIDYLYRPEVAAKNTDFLSYANGNLASQKLVAPKILGDKNILSG